MSDPRATVAPMQSEQQKQQKRERDRLERETRRQSVRASRTVLELAGDMSNTLFEFARPFTQGMTLCRGAEELKARLRFAAVVWNAVIEAEGDPLEAFIELVEDMEAKTGQVPPAAVIFVLSKRKADEFAADTRLFRFVDVQVGGDRVRITASARRNSFGVGRL
jgi:hypothetical protein